MKTIKIFNKELSIFKLCAAAAVIIFAISLITAVIFSAHQGRVQKEKEEALLSAIDGSVNVCDKIFAKMDRTDDTIYNSFKANIDNAVNAADKYYALESLMNYTDDEFNRKFRDEAASEYQKLPPNNYEADKYQQELTALFNEYYDAYEALEKAKGEYTLIK